MHSTRRNLQLVLSSTLALGLSLATGCAGISKFPDKPREAELTSEERAAEVVRDFERKRDEAQFSAAAQKLGLGDLSGSQTNLQQLLARSPEHRAARLLLAEVFVCQGQPQMAAMQLETAGKHHPSDAEIEHTLALVRDSMDQREAALAHYRRAAELAPDNSLYVASVETATRAPLAPFTQSEPTLLASAPAGNSIRTIGPTAPSTEVQAVSYAGPVGPTPVAAPIPTTPPANLAVELDAAPLPPGQSAQPINEGIEQCFAEIDQMPVGMAMAALQRGDEPPASAAGSAQLTKAGFEAIAAGNSGAALELFRQAMTADPQNPQIPILAAVEFVRRGEAAEAVDLLAPVAQSFPSSPRFHQTLGLAFYRAGNYQAAQSSLQHALRLDNTHALSYFLLGSTLAKLGEREAAAKHFDQARALDPKFDLRR